MNALLERPLYLNKLEKWRGRCDTLKIVTGVRRCGKSILFELFRRRLAASGVARTRIHVLNFEMAENAPYLDWKVLHDHILLKTKARGLHFVFLDEVQLVPDFQKALNSLRLKGRIAIYATGSNAFMFSGQLATLLSGRFIEIKMFPLSFKEFVSSFPAGRNADEMFAEYINGSSFPQVLSFAGDRMLLHDYLLGLHNTVVQKDIILRGQYKDITRLENVVRFLFSTIGSETSIRNISNTLGSDNRPVHPQTIESYIQSLIDSYLIYRCGRYDIKGKQLLKSNAKYYVVDMGLRRVLLSGVEGDSGHILENIVYLELLRRGGEVFVGKSGDTSPEVDFVVQQPGGEVEYVQVSQTVMDEKTLSRELAPLRAVKDNHPKTLLTRDFGSENYAGVKRTNVLDWLLA